MKPVPSLFAMIYIVGCIVGISELHAQTRGTQYYDAQATASTVGEAQVSKITSGVAYNILSPPPIYWHDPEWSIDLVAPIGLEVPWHVTFQHNGTTGTITLPDWFEQIRSILRTPDNKVIVTQLLHTGDEGFALIRLDDLSFEAIMLAGYIKISPNNRFIFFELWQPHQYEGDGFLEHEYRIYDTAQTPRQNTCAYMPSDPEHKRPESGETGYQIFPPTIPAGTCAFVEHLLDSENEGAWPVWSDDSTKLAFVDFRDNTAQIVVAIPPAEPKGPPKILVYPLKGECAGPNKYGVTPYCDPGIVKSVEWVGDSVRVRFGVVALEQPTHQVAIPLSSFQTPKGVRVRR